MNRGILLGTSLLLIVPALVWLAIDAVEARFSETITQSVRVARCFQDTELSKSLATLKLQGGPELVKVHESLLTKSKTAPGCQTQLVQALISSMAQATDPAGNQYKNFFFWQSGASLLADLRQQKLSIYSSQISTSWAAVVARSTYAHLVFRIAKAHASRNRRYRDHGNNDAIAYCAAS